MKIIEYLRGKKSYIIGSLMVAIGIMQKDTQLILEGFGVITIRAGIAKMN